jgi:hypothetical protein
MKRGVQAAAARPLRRAVWNWIDLFPDEFNEALRYRGRMEGTPERTFDLLYEQQQGTEKALWPSLTILNCISSERLGLDFQVNHFGSGHFGGHKGGHRKVCKLECYRISTRTEALPVLQDHRFIEDLVKHANTASKFSEVALACTLDMCRVAFHIRPEGEVPLRTIGSDIAHEIKVRLSNECISSPIVYASVSTGFSPQNPSRQAILALP